MKFAATYRGVLCALLLQTAITISTAHADIITLTSGDPGGGYAPAANLIYAYAFEGPNPVSLQGVNFQADQPPTPASDFTLTGNSQYFSGTSALGATPNDLALQTLNENFLFVYNPADSPAMPGFGPLTLTLENLNPGQTYQVDAFVNTTGADGNAYNENFLFNGAQPDNFTAANQVYYDVRENVVATGSGGMGTGQIVVTLNSVDGSGFSGGYGRFNAISVTQAVAVPEPGSLVLLGLGAFGLLALRRFSGVKR